MIYVDEDALICDFAETYHILDFRALPPEQVATLACGLRENSRIKMKLSDRDMPRTDELIAAAVDRLSLIWWSKTKDAAKGKNKPQLILAPKEKADDLVSFKSGDDLMTAIRRKQRGE